MYEELNASFLQMSFLEDAKRIITSKTFAIGLLVSLGILGPIWMIKRKRFPSRPPKRLLPPPGRKSFSRNKFTYVDPWIGSMVPSPRQFHIPVKDRDGEHFSVSMGPCECTGNYCSKKMTKDKGLNAKKPKVKKKIQWA